MTEDDVTIRLSRQEALVLFEFLTRADEREELVFEDQAEQWVLWDIEAQLDKILVEPFRPDYEECLRKARDAVRDSAD